MAGRIAYYGGIVTDGLVLHLDAAKRDSYPGSGTVWRDLSGNGNNGTLVNGVGYDRDSGNGAMVFDGVDDYVRVNNVETSSEFSFQIVVNRLTTPSYDYESFLHSSGESFQRRDRIGFSTNLRFNWRYRKPDGSYATLQSGTNYVSLNETNILSATYDGTDVKFYKNGVLTNTFTNITFYEDWGDQFNLGYNQTNNSFFDGKIYNLLSYNRALTADEVLQNYNALKSRFGL